MAVALVLGAGGPVGYAFHAGVLAALEDVGWDPRRADLVVGTSIGAVTAGLLRGGMAACDLYARATHAPLSDDGTALLQRAGGWPTFVSPASAGGSRWGRPASPLLLRSLVSHPRRVRPGLLLAGMASAGGVETAPIADAFDRIVTGGWPAETWICSVDLDGGQRVVFGRPGSPPAGLGTAIAASCAVPSYFAPVLIGGRRYVDGGVHSPSNCDLVGASDLGDTSDLRDAPRAVIVSLPMGAHGPAGRRGVDLPGRRLNQAVADRSLRWLRAAGIPVLMVAPVAAELEVMGYDAFDTSNLPMIASRARASLSVRLSSAPASSSTARVLDVLAAGGHGRA